jgi:hypothetical protein
MRTGTLLVVVVALLTAGGFGAASLRRQTEKIRSDTTELRQQLASIRAVHEQRRHAEAETAALAAAKGAVIRSEIETARTAVSSLEKRAQEQYAEKLAAAAVECRDPEKGMTRLENLKNAGQATPATAFETLAWAGRQGDYATMLATIAIDPSARAAAETLRNNLSPVQREKYGTPESVMALVLSKGFVTLSGIQIVSTEFVDEQTATLTVRGLVASDQHLQMKLGPNGWRLFEGKDQLAWFQHELAP